MKQRISLNYFPRQWQREVHLKLKRFNVVVVHRRGGKSEVAIMELVNRALTTDKEMWLGAYVAPYQKQARAIAWARIKQKIEPLRGVGLVEVNESEMSVTFSNTGAVVRLFGADIPHALRGLRIDFAVIDEVAQVKKEVWEDVIQPALADRKGIALFIGTPYGVNMFSELYEKALKDPAWFAARFTCFDTEALDADELARLERDMPEQVFRREMMCDFTAAGDNQLISLSDVAVASARHYGLTDYVLAPRILSCDPARFGDDRSVIFKRQGLVAFEPIVLKGVDNMELAARMAVEISDWSPDAVFIDAGAGAGVIDRLRQLGHSVVEVPFGGKPSDATFLNKRAEMWFAMAAWLRDGGAVPDRLDLKQDLATPVYWFDAQGRRQLEPKDDIKKRGLPSPDLADALALTFAHPVAPRPPDLGIPRRNTPAHEYDPYAHIGRTLDAVAPDHNPYAN